MTHESPESEATEIKDPEALKAEAESGSDLNNVPEEDRDAVANKLVDRFCLWSGAAGLIPIPVVDLLTVGGVQLQMVRKLSQIYQVPFTENRGKSVIASVAGALVPATSAAGVTSSVKFVPIVGQAVGMTAMPVFSAGATYVIGKVFIQHFASGGTLLDFNPPDYREFIKEHQAKWKARQAAKSGGADASDAEDGDDKSTAGSAT